MAIPPGGRAGASVASLSRHEHDVPLASDSGRAQADAAEQRSRRGREAAGVARMRVGILAGGLGTRLAEETEVRPKPMVEIGGRPILWHIMRHYLRHDLDHFVIALGYKGEHIKRYIVDYYTYNDSNLTVDMHNGGVKAFPTAERVTESWTVDLIETGSSAETGARVKRIAPYLGNETFMLTYGDGVSNVDLRRLLEFHKSHGKLATITAVHPPSRFGKMEFEGEQVLRFVEKP